MPGVVVGKRLLDHPWGDLRHRVGVATGSYSARPACHRLARGCWRSAHRGVGSLCVCRHRRRFHAEHVRHMMLLVRLQDVVLQLGNQFPHLGVHALVLDVGGRRLRRDHRSNWSSGTVTQPSRAITKENPAVLRAGVLPGRRRGPPHRRGAGRALAPADDPARALPRPGHRRGGRQARRTHLDRAAPRHRLPAARPRRRADHRPRRQGIDRRSGSPSTTPSASGHEHAAVDRPGGCHGRDRALDDCSIFCATGQSIS